MSTTVLFCDLCNESVPQHDIETGSAQLANGRVICATCERLMSADEVGGSSVGAPAGPRAAAAPRAPGAAGAARAGSSWFSSPGGPAASAAHAEGFGGDASGAERRRHRAPAGGAGLAALAVLTAIGIGWKLDGKIEEAHKRYDASLAKYTLEYQGATGAVRGSGEKLRASNDELRAAMLAELSSYAQDLEASQQRWTEHSQSVIDELRDFDLELTSFQKLAGLIDRHDKEMVGLQAKFAGLLDDMTKVSGRVLALEERPVVTITNPDFNAAGGGAAPANSAGAGTGGAGMDGGTQAAWFDLLGGLQSANADERWLAVDELGQTGDPAVAEHLVPMLADEDTFVRMATARILGELAAPVGVPALIDALEDDEAAVREAAMSGLQSATGRDLRFDPHGSPAERAKRVKAWRDWWDKEGEDFGG